MKKSEPESPKYRAEYARSILMGAVAGLALAVAFAAGFFLRDITHIAPVYANNGDSTAPGYPLLDEVQEILDRVYLREQPDYTQRQYAAIQGLLKLIDDKYTFFISPPVAASESDVLAGTYGGVGILLKLNESGRYVVYPYPDSPALKAGITDGDVLLAINGTQITLADQADTVDQQLRGEVKDDNGVELMVQKSDSSTMTVFIKFEVINVPSVLWHVTEEDSSIGYLQIMRFTNRTPDEVKAAISGLRAASIKALILDMRQNPGGLVTESVEVASQFLDGGVVAYEDSRENERSFDVVPGGTMTDLPMVILVDKNTASAAELVAGALHDRGRGVLIGQKTYGKGTVQQIFPLTDGSSIHVTAAEWFTPSKTPLDGIGLEPDIPMIKPDDGRDVETGEAIRYLQQKLTEGSSS